MEKKPFLIYNASAGAGKTFTLVSHYLITLLERNAPDTYRRILAITFTNKAVGEMKERILDALHEFSNESMLSHPSAMFQIVQEALKVSPETLVQRASQTFDHLLHHYASFDVLTIDKFNHRLIRTFARDLKLPLNFQVQLDTELLLEEAIARTLAKAGQDEALTEYLIRFAKAKVREDQSWDLQFPLQKLGKLLFNENHLDALAEVRTYSLLDYTERIDTLRKERDHLRKTTQETAKNLLDRLRSEGIEHTSFSGRYFPNFLIKATNALESINTDAQWLILFREKEPYPKRTSPEQKALIDSLKDELANGLEKITGNIQRYQFTRVLQNKLLPQALLSYLAEEIRKLSEEREILSISEFNSKIADAIKDQPAPFLYERLGERYRHFFIDEFQDTSVYQWANLQPLISNALEAMDAQGKTGSLMIVGDAKQAIYRWRGGRAEQFISLYEGKSPFQIEPHQNPLEYNFRSRDNIVSFNNAFFAYSAQYLHEPAYQELYASQSRQKLRDKPGGCVSIQFLEASEKEAQETLTIEAVVRNINQLLNEGFRFADMCVLVRKNTQGSRMASLLKDCGFPVTSSESLLIASDVGVQLLIAMLEWSLFPEDPLLRFEALRLMGLMESESDLHDFITRHHTIASFSALLISKGCDLHVFKNLSLFSASVYLVEKLKLEEKSESYIHRLLEDIFHFSQSDSGSISRYLEHWKKQKDKLSLGVQEGIDAIQVMTIHKAKGLEFPVVLMPFMTQKFNEHADAFWISEEGDTKPRHILMEATKKLTEIAPHLQEEVTLRAELGRFDDFNVLYVGLTRAVERLYLFSDAKEFKHPKESKDGRANYYHELLKGFVVDHQLKEIRPNQYFWGEYGQRVERVSTKSLPVKTIHQQVYSRLPATVSTTASSLWDTSLGKAIEKGNTWHRILAEIHYAADLESVLEEAGLRGWLESSEITQAEVYLSKLLNHPLLDIYYKEPWNPFNEREIIDHDGTFHRPDRFVVKDKEVVIIDYKTGGQHVEHRDQLHRYANIFKSMGYVVSNSLLVYINEEIQVISLH